jgi:hypothetical protein
VFWIWAFVCGLPLGVLGFLALPAASLSWLPACAGAGGVALAAAGWLAERFGIHAPDRGRHLARAVSVGWAALPAALGSWLSLGPGAPAGLALLVGVVVVLLHRAGRSSGPGAGFAGQLRAVLLALFFGTVGFAAWAGLLAGWSGRAADAPPSEARARYVYDLDARVATRPLPICEGAARLVDTIASGARPALAADGALWFDAPDAAGRRQVRRRDPVTGEIGCFTCDQPGNNVRPRPAAGAQRVVFETDRHAALLRPIDRDLYLMTAPGPPPAVRLHRVTYGGSADLYGGISPGGQALVWSSADGGVWAVVTAGLGTGHGGITVGPPKVLVPGGSEWIAPLAWSADARHLALLRGGPNRFGRGELLDPATGETRPLEVGDDHLVDVAFSGDGGFLAAVSARPDAWASAIPGKLGVLTAPIGLLRGSTAAAPLRDTALHVGETRGGSLRRVTLGEAGGWGYPTGVALTADGTRVYVGQRRGGAAGAEERILELDLCS